MKTRLLPFLILLLAPTLAFACSVPVFRYALERWDLAKYEITVFYERTLPADLEKSLKLLEANQGQANITVTRVDLQGTVAPEYAKQWAMQTDKKTLPWLAARLPETSAKLPDAWAGPFSEANLRLVLDSPARQQLVKHLSQGTTAVFVLLPGNDDKANAKARALLDAELPRQAKLKQLPELKAEDKLRTAIPFKIEFKTIVLNRDDPAELAFIQTLLHTEPDLVKVRGPIVLPVFGRGRLLCSMFGEDLSGVEIANVVRFLCGDCSCQVKELNPGVDLLLAADWTDILAKAGPPSEPVAVKPAAVVIAEGPISSPSSDVNQEVAVSTPAASTNPSVIVPPSVSETSPVVECDDCPLSKMANHGWLLAAIGGAGVLVFATGIWVFTGRAERRQPPG